MTAPAAQLTSRAATIGGVALVAAGVLLGGVLGGIVAGAALYVSWLLSPRWVAAGALVGLVVAAGATAAEWDADAAGAARLAGIATLVAVATAAAVERAPTAEPVPRPTEQAIRRAGRWIAIVTVAAPGLALAVALWLGSGGPALDARDRAVVLSLQAGTGLAHVQGAGTVPSESPPLAPIVAAFLPGSPERAVLVAWLATVLAAAALARAVAGFTAAVVAGAVAAVLAAVATPQLPEALAALGIVGAAVLLQPEDRSLGRSLSAGLAVGAAVLARPDAALVALVAVVVLTIVGGVRHGAAVAGGVVLVVMPWLTWHARTFDTWWAFEPLPGETPGVWLAPVAAVAAAVAVVRLAGRIRERSPSGDNDRPG